MSDVSTCFYISVHQYQGQATGDQFVINTWRNRLDFETSLIPFHIRSKVTIKDKILQRPSQQRVRLLRIRRKNCPIVQRPPQQRLSLVRVCRKNCPIVQRPPQQRLSLVRVCRKNCPIVQRPPQQRLSLVRVCRKDWRTSSRNIGLRKP